VPFQVEADAFIEKAEAPLANWGNHDRSNLTVALMSDASDPYLTGFVSVPDPILKEVV